MTEDSLTRNASDQGPVVFCSSGSLDMAALNPRLAGLSDDDRQVLDSWLVEFDQGWDKGRLMSGKWWGRDPRPRRAGPTRLASYRWTRT